VFVGKGSDSEFPISDGHVGSVFREKYFSEIRARTVVNSVDRVEGEGVDDAGIDLGATEGVRREDKEGRKGEKEGRGWREEGEGGRKEEEGG
jgi:hypothetical protein